MAVVDSSALIPLSWIGRLDLVGAVFDEIRTTESVRDEVLTPGKRGTATLDAFLDDVSIHETVLGAESVATLEGIAEADASVILLADDTDEVLLANDKGLVDVARSHDVECWWVTTLVLKCTKEGAISAEEASEIVYDLVDEGMNLHPKVYSRIQRKLDEME